MGAIHSVNEIVVVVVAFILHRDVNREIPRVASSNTVTATVVTGSSTEDSTLEYKKVRVVVITKKVSAIATIQYIKLDSSSAEDRRVS